MCIIRSCPNCRYADGASSPSATFGFGRTCPRCGAQLCIEFDEEGDHDDDRRARHPRRANDEDIEGE